ncbi:AAA family ATPase [Flavobacterium coralii]|uniref:NACHT domain-containing protein n=1 Tax=Flavobacterium coralii TaxID=2838017 RepID=UPI000C6B5F84|nr:hypothetical protein [Flavobacterium sp.]|tara:strand:- start:33557 stop:36157 length:2601 start_codon:yes stop_codon:yes gene_type:complete
MELKLKGSDFTTKVNFKEAVKNFFDFNIATAITEIVSIEANAEMKAFLLLYNTITKTCVSLAKELDQEKVNQVDNLQIISSDFEIKLRNLLENEIILSEEFFYDSLNFNKNYLIHSYKLFDNYIALLKIKTPKNYEYIFYKKFRENLLFEFQYEKEKYIELLDYFKNPIIKENIQFDALIDYYITIKSFFTNDLRPNTEYKERLSDLYIEPYFEVFVNNSISEYTSLGFVTLEEEINIHDYISSYFIPGEKHPEIKQEYNMLFILGQPGQGKTSLCYKVVYDYLESETGLPNIPIYFVKIRDLVAKDFINSPFDEINSVLKNNVNFNSCECILILDGLDEAYMAGGISDNDLRNLYDRLNKTTSKNKKLKIILTSRFNYLNINESCLDGSLVIQLNELTDEQIILYAEKFKLFYPENNFINKVKVITNNDNYEHIKELLKQAVIIYFVAIADIDVDDKDSKSKIYDKIFDTLSKRAWDNSGQLDFINSKVKTNSIFYQKQLRDYIRSIAFEIYQSPNLYITLNRLISLDSTKNFIKKCFSEDINSSPDKLKDISKYLLISFYFQESKNNPNSDTAIEFFHNSLWEFLTAEYIWEENKRILLQKDEYDDFKDISVQDYFNYLNKLVKNKTLNDAVFENLIELIKNDDNEVKKNVVSQITPLFSKLVENSFLLDYRVSENQINALQKIFGIFEVVWTFYHTSNTNLENPIEINNEIRLYLFSYRKKFQFNYNFANVKFLQGYPLSLNNSYENVAFYNEYFVNITSESSFYKCYFNSGFHTCEISHCDFEDVTFDNCYFHDTAEIIGNNFSKCTFIDTSVSSEKWYNFFIENNHFDEDFLNNYELSSRPSLGNNEEEEEVFYIRQKQQI